MIDAVLGYHLNPHTCGVAKFNVQLAEHLRVPHLAWRVGASRAHHPLVSIKPAEVTAFDLYQMRTPYDLLLHGPADRWALDCAAKADRVYVVDPLIQTGRSDTCVLPCPPTLRGRADRGAFQVLTFGMAHKRLLPHFWHLKDELDATHPDYTVSLSTAVHEGSPWQRSLDETIADMTDIFGDKLRVLGFLADDALARELAECDAVAVYFDPAMRANNTSAWAAIAAGKPLYTNRDARSPDLAHLPTWADVQTILQEQPTCAR